jgi:hypothetical protein
MANTNPSLTSMTPKPAGERNFVNIHRDTTVDVNADKLANNGNDGMSGKSASKSVKVFNRKKFHMGNDMAQSIAGYDPKASQNEAVHVRSFKRTLGKKRAFIDEKPVTKKHVKENVNEALGSKVGKKDLGGLEIMHTMNMGKKMDQQMWGKDSPTDPDRTGEISFHSAMRAWAARQRVNMGHIHDSNDMKGLSKFSKEMQKRGREKAAFKEGFIDFLRNEKWDSDYETPKSKKGMWDGYSLEDLHKAHKTATGKRAKEIDFAIRAKTGWGKVGEGVVLDHPAKQKLSPSKRFALHNKNKQANRQADFSRRMGYEFPKPKAVGENETLPWLSTIAEKKALSEKCIQISDKDFLAEKVAFVKKLITRQSVTKQREDARLKAYYDVSMAKKAGKSVDDVYNPSEGK